MTVTSTGPSSVFASEPSEGGACAGQPGLRQFGAWHRLLNEGEERGSSADGSPTVCQVL